MMATTLIENILDGLIKNASNNKTVHDPSEFKNWKKCIALIKLGWKAESTKDGTSDRIIMIWKKEGKPDVRIVLSFIEQCYWFEYLKKQKERQ